MRQFHVGEFIWWQRYDFFISGSPQKAQSFTAFMG